VNILKDDNVKDIKNEIIFFIELKRNKDIKKIGKMNNSSTTNSTSSNRKKVLEEIDLTNSYENTPYGFHEELITFELGYNRKREMMTNDTSRKKYYYVPVRLLLKGLDVNMITFSEENRLVDESRFNTFGNFNMEITDGIILAERTNEEDNIFYEKICESKWLCLRHWMWVWKKS